MKSNIFKTLSAVALALVVSSCTKDFEEINTNPTGVPDSSIPVGSRLQTPQKWIFNGNFQCGQNLQGDIYSGQQCPPTLFNGGISNAWLAFMDGWTQTVMNKSNNQILKLTSEIIELSEEINYVEYVAICKIINVMGCHRTADYFGSIVYSQYGANDSYAVYDKPVELYQSFMDDLSGAADDIIDFIKNDPNYSLNRLAEYDYTNEGDLEMWVKFANTLHLRLAMRVVNYDAAWAKEEAEKAIKREYGLLTSADSNIDCEIELLNNELYVMTETYADTRMGASFMSIMNGLADPRMSVMTYPIESAITDIDGNASEESVGKYVGIRPGASIIDKTNYKGFSRIKGIKQITTDEPMVWMKPSEAYFLLAEAALRGWDVNGAGTAQSLYEAGVTQAFNEVGASGVAAYLENDVISDDVQYIDYYNDANSIRFGDAEDKYLIDVPVKWDESASNVEKLEKIITQSYLAVFPDGNEAWSLYRRTGFPSIFLVVPDGNLSEQNTNYNGDRTVPKDDFLRRLPYPSTEYDTNDAQVRIAATYLEGEQDTAMAKMFWDTDCINNPENNF